MCASLELDGGRLKIFVPVRGPLFCEGGRNSWGKKLMFSAKETDRWSKWSSLLVVLLFPSGLELELKQLAVWVSGLGFSLLYILIFYISYPLPFSHLISIGLALIVAFQTCHSTTISLPSPGVQ